MIEQVLQEIGLTKSEIKVYLALLDLGESKSGDILKKSNLNSGKIYEILDSLQRKGLVSYIIKSNIKYFSPADPKRVLDYLEEKKQEITKQEKDYNTILPELLKKISSFKSKTKIEIFTGFKGMKSAYYKELDRIKNNTLYVLGIVPFEQYSKNVINFFNNDLRQKRENSKSKIKKLLSESARKELQFQEKNAEVKYLPYGSIISINIVGNLTTIGIFTEEMIFISIESEEVANNFIKQFELLWKQAKK